MAITPRTILTSAAPATVAVVSLYFFTVLGTAAFTCLTDNDEAEEPTVVEEIDVDSVLDRSTSCDHVADRMHGEPEEWSEIGWYRLADCFGQQQKDQLAVDTARQGLEFHPDSEILFNTKGYHQIMLDKHAEAIDTLEEGMERVTHHRNGVMANNLAWAGLWEPRKVHLDEARDLYIQALARTPDSCEMIHTGLFVEFALADQADGIDQFEPRKRFSDLRDRYNSCLDRLQDGDRETLVEIVGAAVLFDEVDHTRGDIHPLMHSTTSMIAEDYEDETAHSICEDAMPLADFHHDCVESVEQSLAAHERLARQHQQRNERANQVRKEITVVDHDGATFERRIEIRSNSTGDSGCGGMKAVD